VVPAPTPTPDPGAVIESVTQTDANQTSTGRAKKKKAAAARANQGADQTAAAASQVQTQIVVLPDRRQNFLLPVSHRPFVKDDTTLIFSNGMLAELDASRPSLIAGIVGFPQAILAAVAPIPLQIKQNQVNNIQAKANYLKAESDIHGYEHPTPPANQ